MCDSNFFARRANLRNSTAGEWPQCRLDKGRGTAAVYDLWLSELQLSEQVKGRQFEPSYSTLLPVSSRKG